MRAVICFSQRHGKREIHQIPLLNSMALRQLRQRGKGTYLQLRTWTVTCGTGSILHSHPVRTHYLGYCLHPRLTQPHMTWDSRLFTPRVFFDLFSWTRFSVTHVEEYVIRGNWTVYLLCTNVEEALRFYLAHYFLHICIYTIFCSLIVYLWLYLITVVFIYYFLLLL